MGTKVRQNESLFAEPQPIDRVDQVRSGYARTNTTSKTQLEAAIRLRPISGKVRRAVMETIKSAGFHGITRKEIETVAGIRIPSVCSAVKALVEGNFVKETDKVRDGGAVLIPTERGWRA